MSMSLLKKAIQIFDDDDINASTAKRRLDEELPTKKYGLKREKLKLKSRFDNSRSKSKFTMKDKKVKSRVDEYRRKKTRDQTEENLLFLQQLDDIKPKPESMKKILDHHQQKFARYNKDIIEVKEPEPVSILFPEENIKKKKKRRRNYISC